MRYWTGSAIKLAKHEANLLYKKLGSYAPDEKLNNNDIGRLLYILRNYNDELESIEKDRLKAKKLAEI